MREKNCVSSSEDAGWMLWPRDLFSLATIKIATGTHLAIPNLDMMKLIDFAKYPPLFNVLILLL